MSAEPRAAAPEATRRIAVIANPSAGAGRARRRIAEVERALASQGLTYRVDWTRSLEHAAELARGAADAGEVAAAFGGDGLVAAVTGALKHSDGVVGVLPGGRGNDLARVLGIPREPAAACAVLASGTVRPLDLGEVGERTFVGIASCGFDSEANRIANESRLVRGSLVYAYAALRALLRWRPATFSVRLDGGDPHSLTGYTVAAANSPAYGGGMLLAPDASLEDGMLDVVLVGHVPKGRFLRLLPTVFKGAHVRQRNVAVLRAAEVRIDADRPFTLYADGDPIAPLPVTVRALPAAVKVLVPR
jgi:YegS/Rv2252/BmrU family lipid kinase